MERHFVWAVQTVVEISNWMKHFLSCLSFLFALSYSLRIHNEEDQTTTTTTSTTTTTIVGEVQEIETFDGTTTTTTTTLKKKQKTLQQQLPLLQLLRSPKILQRLQLLLCMKLGNNQQI